MNKLKRELKGHYVVLSDPPEKPLGQRVILCLDGEGCSRIKLGKDIVGEFPHSRHQVTFSAERIEKIASRADVAMAFDERGRIAREIRKDYLTWTGGTELACENDVDAYIEFASPFDDPDEVREILMKMSDPA